MINRDEYIEKMKDSLDKLNAHMGELELKSKAAQKDVAEKYAAEMEKLRAQSKLAVAKLEEMQAAGADTWQSMVAEVEKVRDAFAHSFNYFKSQI